MDAKKLIEGLPISIKANAIKANSTDMGLETVRIMAYPTETRTALDVAEAIGWRVLLALMDEQEQPSDFFSGPEWDEKWDRKYVPDDSAAVGLARARGIRKAIDYLLSKEKL